MSARVIPRPLIHAGALLAGLLFALAVHVIGQRFGFDLGALWSGGDTEPVPLRAGLAWWITASGAFAGGYVAARIMNGAASGELPAKLRYLLIGLGVVVLAGAGQAASAPGSATTASSVLAGCVAVLVGAALAFCGAQFALQTARQ